jgi:hypothetical protein
MTDPAPTVDYEQVVSGYEQSLTTVLRGFKAAERFEFLETWVPDDDAGQSIFGILEAAKDYGLRSLVVAIGQATLRTLDLSRLRAMIEPLGQVRIERTAHGAELAAVFNE